MSRQRCPHEGGTLAAHRRGRVDASNATHVDSCAVCGAAIAADRALALLAGSAEDTRPFPSAAALRLEADLRREERRLAGRARASLGLHAGALALSVALLAAVWVMEAGPRSSPWSLGGAGSLCAIVVVAISIWNLFRSADESAVPS
jgi:hypothetical protein